MSQDTLSLEKQLEEYMNKPQIVPIKPEPFVMDETYTINTKNDHTSGRGIYAVSERVRSYSQVGHIVEPMIAWLNHNNGHFPVPYQYAYAVSHCQVSDVPFSFFVVHHELIGGKKEKKGRNTAKNYYFQSPAIFNAKIVEAPEKIEAKTPSRELVKDAKGKTTGSKIVVKEGMVSNLIDVPEACMSFVHRKQKNHKRYYRIKVKYQEVASLFGVKYLRTRMEWVEGLKAHIFQHEIDHAQGKNMFYKN